MKKEYTTGDSWNSAAVAGLVLALVTIAAELVASLCGKVNGFAGGFLAFLAWACKLVLCAVVFRYLLKRFQSSFDGIGYPNLHRYGLKLALFSSIVVAAYAVLNILVINPGSLDEITGVFRESYASMMDSNAEAALEKMLPKMPVYMGIGTFVYCFIWGWLYSKIFARSVTPDDPFSETEDKTGNQ
ncbi:MAG: DUF4199 domain-containing protein [Bacteroidales bacterium]|nr:DUF4199 domain-containing protein [Bacteroidales bacterium]